MKAHTGIIFQGDSLFFFRCLSFAAAWRREGPLGGAVPTLSASASASASVLTSSEMRLAGCRRRGDRISTPPLWNPTS